MPDYYLQCLEDGETFIAGEEQFAAKFSDIRVKFERCDEYQPFGFCAKEPEVSSFWDAKFYQAIIVQLSHMQVNMKNQSQPLEPVTQFYSLIPKLNSKIQVKIQLQPNEFTDEQGILGVKAQSDEP